MKKLFITALLAMLTMTTMSGQIKLKADNIDEVMKAMTLEEKAKLLVIIQLHMIQISTGQQNTMTVTQIAANFFFILET